MTRRAVPSATVHRHKREVSGTMTRTMLKLFAAAAIGAATLTLATAASAQALRDNWCGDVKIRFFAGGAEGDAFASIVYNGAKQAAQDLGAQVDYIFSGWSSEKMIQQLREAVAARPDGIAMMGHPGNAAIMPLAEEAATAGIKMMYQNVPTDEVTAKFGGGYVGAQQYPQGKALGEEAIRRFGLKSGDVAIVMSDWSQIERAERELGTLEAFEAAGMKVVKLQNPEGLGTDPNVGIPVITAAISANPDVKVIAYPGGQPLGNASVYMQAAGKAPGDVINIGFDTSPQIVQMFAEGWVQLTSDQQPFLQGYIPVLSLCQQVVYGLGAMNVDTGAGFVTPDNYEAVAALATEGLR
jgi:simple sugar transport system substrate-binding protein